MALWHWLVAGGAAYMLLKPKTGLAAGTAGGTAGSGVNTPLSSTEATMTANYVNTALGVTGAVVVQNSVSGFYVMDSKGAVLVGPANTLADLNARARSQYPLTSGTSGWGYGYGRY